MAINRKIDRWSNSMKHNIDEKVNRQIDKDSKIKSKIDRGQKQDR